MKRRLFIAINLPEGVKKGISSGVAGVENALKEQARFSKEKKWHITLVFLGYQEDMALSGILAAMEDTAKEFSGPKIEIGKDFVYVPEKSPKMIWLRGSKETSAMLGKMKDFLEEKLIDNKVHFKTEYRSFNSHVTICRFADFMRGDLPTLIPYSLKTNLNFNAGTLDLMESHLSRKGAEYELLQSMDFKGGKE